MLKKVPTRRYFTYSNVKDKVKHVPTQRLFGPSQLLGRSESSILLSCRVQT
jgi:hypothetical protein